MYFVRTQLLVAFAQVLNMFYVFIFLMQSAIIALALLLFYLFLSTVMSYKLKCIVNALFRVAVQFTRHIVYISIKHFKNV